MAVGHYSVDQPWFPIAEPVEFPAWVKPAWVGKIARNESDVLTLDRVVRSHLYPLRHKDKSYEKAWRTFWRALAFADRRNVEDLLNQWMEKATFAAARPDLPEDEAVCINRFIGDVKGALGRLSRGKCEPMAWAGPEFAKYPPEQRFVLEGLIGAITLHRSGDINDMELYSILQNLEVDPAERHVGINADNLDAIKHSCITGDPLELQTAY